MKPLTDYIFESIHNKIQKPTSESEILESLAKAFVEHKQWKPEYLHFDDEKDPVYFGQYSDGSYFIENKTFLHKNEWKLIFRKEQYEKALKLLEDMHYIVGVDSDKYHHIMPIFLGNMENRMSAGEVDVIYSPDEMNKFYEFDTEEWPKIGGCIREDFIPSQYKKYATLCGPVKHASRDFEYPEKDINGKKIMYANICMNTKTNKWYIGCKSRLPIVKNQIDGGEEIDDIKKFTQYNK